MVEGGFYFQMCMCVYDFMWECMCVKCMIVCVFFIWMFFQYTGWNKNLYGKKRAKLLSEIKDYDYFDFS